MCFCLDEEQHLVSPPACALSSAASLGCAEVSGLEFLGLAQAEVTEMVKTSTGLLEKG